MNIKHFLRLTLLVMLTLCVLNLCIGSNWTIGLKSVNTVYAGTWSSDRWLNSSGEEHTSSYTNFPIYTFNGRVTALKTIKIIWVSIGNYSRPRDGSATSSIIGQVIQPDTTVDFTINYNPQNNYTGYGSGLSISDAGQNGSNEDIIVYAPDNSTILRVGYQILNNSIPVSTPIAPVSGDVFRGDSYCIPSISVLDTDNDTVTCKYYIDNETTPRETKTALNTGNAQTVNFSSINIGTLLQGSHTIKYEFDDGLSKKVKRVVVMVDKSGPKINRLVVKSTSSSITIEGLATDYISGLNSAGYRYSIGSSISEWTTNTSYTLGSLASNTKYDIKLEAIDKVGNITSSSIKSYYTKP